MLTTMMKYVSIVTITLAAVLWSYTSAYERGLDFVIAGAALMVALQAARAHKPAWAIAFCATVVIFNPFVPTGVFSGGVGLGFLAIAFALFTSSLYLLKMQPLLSVPSITDRNPGSRSL